MKPSDLFLSSRQVYGILFPGIVWLVVVCTLLGEVWPFAGISEMKQSISQQFPIHPGGSLVFSFLVAAGLLCALVLGNLMHRLGFLFTEKLARIVRMDPWLQTRKEAAYRNKVHEALKAHSPLINDMMLAGLDGSQYRQNEKLFLTCKRSIVCRSPELMRHLLEQEDEVNLFAMLPLPVLVLTVVFTVNIHHWQWAAAIIVIAIGILYGLARGFHQSRTDEEITCYDLFLLLETDLSGKPKTERKEYNDTV